MKHRLPSPRGQAMVEYSLVASILLFVGALALLPMVGALLRALSAFYASVYFVIKTAAI